MPSSLALVPSLEVAWQDVDSSFERFCLTAGIGAIERMLREDAEQLTGAPHSRGGGRVGHRWGTTARKIGFHGGKVTVHRPWVRKFDGREAALLTWTAAQAEDWLGRWAMNLMLINVSTRKLRRAVRLPEGDLSAIAEDGTSKSAASRRFVALFPNKATCGSLIKCHGQRMTPKGTRTRRQLGELKELWAGSGLATKAALSGKRMLWSRGRRTPAANGVTWS
jgi:hypothetical protein